MQVQQFKPLIKSGLVRHGFILRVPGLDVTAERTVALERLNRFHEELLKDHEAQPLRLAQQVHGNLVAAVDESSPLKTPGVDALVTATPDLALGIHVADCCAIYFVDPRHRVIGLAHSGKKGTALNIAGKTIELMRSQFGTEAKDLLVQLSPCIRPPFYEIDFAATIREQLRSAGVIQVFDSGENTGADLQKFYSYRMEKGKTGRMLAFLVLRPEPSHLLRSP